MKKKPCKIVILGIMLLWCLVTKDQAFNGVPPPPSAEFKARDQFSEAFDPPLTGDTNTATGVEDKNDWVPYTSIAKSGPYAVNEKCKLVFPTNEAAALCEIVVAADSTQLITVTPSSPGGMNTNITITALAGDAIIREATVQARLKSDHTTVAAQLRVTLLPERTTVQAKFYRVCNANDNEFIENPTENPVADPGEATAEADSRMSQAVVHVASAPPDPPVYGDFSKRTLFFDTRPNPPDGRLGDDWEYQTFANSNMFTGKCNVVYVPRLAVGLGGVVYDPDSKILFIAQNQWTSPGTDFPGGGGFSDDPENGNGASSQMERAMAHEFGHYLRLCSRTIAPGTPNRGHDSFPVPSGTVALMLGGVTSVGRWMRHEDWEQANNVADQKTQ